MSDKDMQVSSFLNFGVENAKRHFLKFIGLFILAGIAIVVGAVVSAILGRVVPFLGAVLGALLMAAITSAIMFGFLKNVLNLCRGEKVDLMVFTKVKPMTIINFIIACMLLNIITFFGFLLFVIPGVILTLMFILTPYLIIDRDMGPIEAIKESMKLTKGRKADIYVGLGVGIAVSLYFCFTLVLLPFGVPMLAFVFVYPYLLLTGQFDEAKKKLEAADAQA